MNYITGIPIIKLEDKSLAKEVGLFAFPSIVFFRNFGEEAIIYAGDIRNEDSILEWILVQMDPSNEAIEDEDGEELESLIENSDSLAVFICKSTFRSNIHILFGEKYNLHTLHICIIYTYYLFSVFERFTR